MRVNGSAWPRVTASLWLAAARSSSSMRAASSPDETDITHGEQQTGSPSGREALASLGMLVVGLVAVVGLAKVESPAIEGAVAAIDAPPAAVGVMIALLVLLPETLATVRNAQRGRLQISLNLAFGSAMASIGLTIPQSPSHQSGCPAGLYWSSTPPRSCCWCSPSRWGPSRPHWAAPACCKAGCGW